MFFFVFFAYSVVSMAYSVYRFETVYLDDEIRVVKDIRGDYLVVDRAPYAWKEWKAKAMVDAIVTVTGIKVSLLVANPIV